jgi:nucleobase:cation symporter-1, NCS1 family
VETDVLGLFLYHFPGLLSVLHLPDRVLHDVSLNPLSLFLFLPRNCIYKIGLANPSFSSVDYWLIRNGNIHVPSLYKAQPGSIYYYTAGFNFRAFAAWAISIALVIPGVAGALNPGSIGTAAVRMYNMGFLLSTVVAGLIYYVTCRIWPVPIYPPEMVAQGKDESWEAMRYTEGFFPEDEVIPEYLREKVLDGMQVNTFVGEKEVLSDEKGSV